MRFIEKPKPSLGDTIIKDKFVLYLKIGKEARMLEFCTIEYEYKELTAKISVPEICLVTGEIDYHNDVQKYEDWVPVRWVNE